MIIYNFFHRLVWWVLWFYPQWEFLFKQHHTFTHHLSDDIPGNKVVFQLIYHHHRGSYHPNVSSQSSQLRFGILTPSKKSSILVLRTVLNFLTPCNKTLQSLFKHAPKRLELNNMLQVSSSSILIILIFLCLHFLTFKCVISLILIFKKS